MWRFFALFYNDLIKSSKYAFILKVFIGVVG